MAEGEFALIREYGEAGLIRPSKGWAIFGDHDLHSLLADAAARGHDAAALRKYTPMAEESAARYDHRLYRAIAHRARGMVHHLDGDFLGSEKELRQALDLFNTLGVRFQAGRTLFELGGLSAAQAKTEEARGYYALALEAFESLQAAADSARVREALESL